MDFFMNLSWNRLLKGTEYLRRMGSDSAQIHSSVLDWAHPALLALSLSDRIVDGEWESLPSSLDALEFLNLFLS